jgi:hypothetical protein
MERREFLIGLGAALLVPAALAAVSGCSSSSTSSTPADSFNVASSVDSAPGGYSHSHIVAVLLADTANPPASGVTYLTSSAEGHAHQVTISRSDLADIQEGKNRSESTTVVSGHQHTFAFSKP